MSNIKSKLAASVRQVKAQASAEPTQTEKPSAKAPGSAQALPAVGKPQTSGSILFPSRVWPD